MFSFMTLIGLIPKIIQFIKLGEDIYQELVAQGKDPASAKQTTGALVIHAINGAIAKETGVNLDWHPMTPEEEQLWMSRMNPVT